MAIGMDMTANWQIASMDVEHFRGVSGSVSLKFGPKLNILAGNNGAGKTSLCHAIEWTLFGKVPVFARGDEFQAEDAIANRLSAAGASKVCLTLRRGSEQVKITRSRPRGNSSTRGTSTVTVEMGTTKLRSKDAETKISELLALQASDVSAGMYLRQETITDLILGDRDLRSAAIDKLLGLGQIRELLGNLQLNTIDRAIKQIDADVSTLQESVINAAALRRVQLARKRETMITRGLDEPTLSTAGTSRMLESSAHSLELLAKEYDAAVSIAQQSHGTLSELAQQARQLDGSLPVLDAAITTKEVTIRSQNSRLEDLLQQYESASKAVLDLQAIDVIGLKRELSELLVQQQEVVAEVKRVSTLRLAVKPVFDQLGSLASKRDALNARIQESGDVDLERQKLVLDDEIKAASGLLEQQSGLDRLVVNAKDFLSEHPSSTCPICTQTINLQQVLTQLQLLTAQGRTGVAELNIRLRKLNGSRQEVQQHLESLQRSKETLVSVEADWRDRIEQLATSGLDAGDGSTETISNLNDLVDGQYRNVAQRQSDLEIQRNQLTARVAGAETVQQQLETALASIKDMLGLETMPVDVIAAITESIVQGEQHLLSIGKARQDVLTYLQDVESVTELEQNVPPVRRRLRQLDAARMRVFQLREAVFDVYNALTAAQQESLEGNLATLMPGVQDIFTALGAHPEYRLLVVEPESDEKTGTNVYRIRAANEEGSSDTFVRTTFSRAELNVVALALFLAVMLANDSYLGVSLLDDPSQSLDLERERALAEVLSALSENRQIIVATEDPNFIERLNTAGDAQVTWLVHTPFGGTVIQE